MKLTKIIGTILGVILFTAVIAGLTYAIINWNSNYINITGTSDCFNIDYGVSKQIGDVNQNEKITMVDSYLKGLYATVTLSLNNQCQNISGLANLYLNTESSGTTNNILNGALKYAVVNSNDLNTVLSSGVINHIGELEILNNIDVDSTELVTYNVYVWLDGNIADSSYIDANYSGYINAKAYSK